MSDMEAMPPLARLADEVRGEAVAYSAGRQTDEEFAHALLELETVRLRPNGVTLAVSHTIDGWITVLMKKNGTGQLAAAFEFRPESRQFRRLSTLSAYPSRNLPRG
jgi:hypothetical protein